MLGFEVDDNLIDEIDQLNTQPPPPDPCSIRATQTIRLPGGMILPRGWTGKIIAVRDDGWRVITWHNVISAYVVPPECELVEVVG